MNRITRPSAITGSLAFLVAISITAPTLGADHGPATHGSSIPAGVLTKARDGFTTTLLPDGRVLVAGGWGDSGASSSVEVWDPETMRFSPAGSLAGARSDHSAVLLPDGRVLVLGESVAGDPASLAELWDPATETFHPAGSLLRPRWGHTVTALLDGRVLVLVVGGGKRLAERWDPVEMSFEAAGRMARPRSDATLLPDGSVLMVGVFEPIMDGSAKRNASIPDPEVWDPTTRSFSPAGAFKRPRRGAPTVLLPDGQVLFVGGWDAVRMSVPTLRSAEVWNPETRSFQRAGRPVIPREEHTTTLLPDGRVALIGGDASPGCGRRDKKKCRGGIVSANVELWDPGTRSFGRGGRLNEARYGHTATLSADGSILVVGGRDAADHLVASAEVWTPGS